MPHSADDLAFATHLADLADEVAMRWWRPAGVAATTKHDGTPVTEADPEVERTLLAAVRAGRGGDGFLGEEVGEHRGDGARRWIVDGIDGTAYFAAGSPTWGTFVALEVDDAVTVGVVTSPALGRRWWASTGQGAWTSTRVGPGAGPWGEARRLRTAPANGDLTAERVALLPWFADLGRERREVVTRLAGGVPGDHGWGQHLLVAEGLADVALWFVGGPWDLAAPSVIVREAGGRWSDLAGGTRLDTRTSLWSSGPHHDAVLAAVAPVS